MRLDPQLVEAAHRGDVDALGDLLARCHPDARRFARSMCATPEDAEDAVQETLWTVSRRIGSLRAASAFTAWLFTMIKRECLRLLRREQRSSPHDIVQGLGPDPERQAVRAALLRDISVAIAELPPEYRRVLVMRDVQSMSAPEVASSLNLTTPAVKTRLHRARRVIRASLLHWVD